MYKAFPTEGGTRVAAFAHFPARFQSGAVSDALLTVKDVAPTFLELAGVEHPGREYRGRSVAPLTGRSMLPLWTGEADRVHEEDAVVIIEAIGKIGIRQGQWKLVRMPEPYGNGNWQLYDLSKDLAEKNDLSATHDAKLRELIELWNTYADEHGVIMPDWLSGY